jgi:hypothetical protein
LGGNQQTISKQSAKKSKISKAPRWCRDVMALAPVADIDAVAAVYGVDPTEFPFGR